MISKTKTQSNRPYKGLILLTIMSTVLTPEVKASIGSSGTQNFVVTGSDADFLTVHGARSVRGFTLGLFVDDNINSAPYFEDFPEKNLLNDHLLSFQLTTALALSDRFSLGIVLPGVLLHSVKEKEALHGSYTKAGITGARLEGKWAFIQGQFLSHAVVVGLETNQTRDDLYASKKLSASVDYVADMSLDRWRLGLNLGYLFSQKPTEPSSEIPVSPLGSQLRFALAGSYAFTSFDLQAEVFGASPRTGIKDISDRASTRGEYLLAARVRHSESLSSHWGASREIRQSIGSPDLRMIAGLYYTFTSTLPVRMPATFGEPDEVFVIQDVLFQFDSAELANTDVAKQQIAELVRRLNAKGGYRFVAIEGHTCSLGSDRYNNRLSEKRARRVRDLLNEEYRLGVSTMSARGFGERRPVASNLEETGRERNRRVEFKIYR